MIGASCRQIDVAGANLRREREADEAVVDALVPGQREHGVGTALMDAICERFRAAGANSVRTMLLRRDTLNLAFFRSQGMIAGEYVQLEKMLSAG